MACMIEHWDSITQKVFQEVPGNVVTVEHAVPADANMLHVPGHVDVRTCRVGLEAMPG